MITEEKLIERLTKIRLSYDPRNQGERERSRYLGAMEAILLVLEVLDLGQTLPYGKVEKIEYNIFSKNTTHMVKESYPQLIVRLVDSFLIK